MSPLLARTAADWLDRATLEPLALGAGRWRLAQLVASELRPRRIVRVGRTGFDVAGPFPGATVDEGRLGDLRRHAGADLVWCDFGLTDAADAAQALVALWRDLGPVPLALVDVLDLGPTRRAAALARTLRLREAPGLLAGIATLFEPLVVEAVDHQEGLWRSVVMVARARERASAQES